MGKEHRLDTPKVLPNIEPPEFVVGLLSLTPHSITIISALMNDGCTVNSTRWLCCMTDMLHLANIGMYTSVQLQE